MKALILLALLLIPLCGAYSEDQIAQIYMNKLDRTMPYIDLLETDCYTSGDEFILSATIENITDDNIFWAIVAGSSTYASYAYENTTLRLKVNIMDENKKIIGYGLCYRRWAEEYKETKDWQKIQERVAGTTRISASVPNSGIGS